ncbi:cytochrome P450 [Xylaria intraflava]|nr:cytochrome P450 [Xylaria intraflava]
MFTDLLQVWDAGRVPNLGTLCLLIAIAAILLQQLSNATAQKKHGGVPATFPHAIPFLGSLPIAYLWKPKDYVLNPGTFFQAAHPVRVKIATREFYAVHGPENIKALFKASASCTALPFAKFVLGAAFGLHACALRLYDRDDSGGGPAPHPDSAVEARNRIDYRTAQGLATFLEGKGLPPFWRRFVEKATRQLHGFRERLGSGWEYADDLMKVVMDETTVSIVDALCGPHLLRLNPDFLRDFWVFDRHLQTYVQGVPRLFAPRAYAARDRVLNAVRVWQQYARDNFTDAALDADGDDPFWGSSFFRERQRVFLEMDGFDHAAVASEDFGAIWAMRNAVNSAAWAIFDIYRDPELLASVRAEVDGCAVKDADGRIRFDIDQLLRLPVLQAVYAETLRLRMHFYIIRMSDRVDLNIQDWIIPRKKVVAIMTTVAHMDTKAWSTGVNGEHPVDQFWVGRFLTYPEKSGGVPGGQASSPTFSTKGLEGSWIPYGGGPRQCPGRHFAKRQILLTIALMVSLFDCEILGDGKDVQGDFTLNGFGGGVSHPAGKVPMRIRRRVDGVA